MARKTFTVDYLKGELHLPYENPEITRQDRITGTGRWTIHHALIFEDPADHKCYEVNYSEGATELQDEGPWEYDTTVEGTEVALYKTVENTWHDADTVPALELNKCIFAVADRAAERIANQYGVNSVSMEEILTDMTAIMEESFREPDGGGIAEEEHAAEGPALEPEPAAEEPEPADAPVGSPWVPHPKKDGVYIHENGEPGKIKLKDFQKFCKKLKDKLSYDFIEGDEFQMPKKPKPNQVLSFSVHGALFPLGDLYAEYQNDKENEAEHPLSGIADRITAEVMGRTEQPVQRTEGPNMTVDTEPITIKEFENFFGRTTPPDKDEEAEDEYEEEGDYEEEEDEDYEQDDYDDY